MPLFPHHVEIDRRRAPGVQDVREIAYLTKRHAASYSNRALNVMHEEIEELESKLRAELLKRELADIDARLAVAAAMEAARPPRECCRRGADFFVPLVARFLPVSSLGRALCVSNSWRDIPKAAGHESAEAMKLAAADNEARFSGRRGLKVRYTHWAHEPVDRLHRFDKMLCWEAMLDVSNRMFLGVDKEGTATISARPGWPFRATHEIPSDGEYLLGRGLPFGRTRSLRFRLRIDKDDDIFDAVGAAIVWRPDERSPRLGEKRIVESYLWNSDGADFDLPEVQNLREVTAFDDNLAGVHPDRLFSSGQLLEVAAYAEEHPGQAGARLNLVLRRIHDDGAGSETLARLTTGVLFPGRHGRRQQRTPELGKLYLSPLVRIHMSSTATLESWGY